MPNVFLSYRRDDAGGHAGRLSDRLVARFGDERVFVDVQDIQPGQNFEQAIEQTLTQCNYLLAVVGPRWLESLRARSAGEDFVRHELAVAIARGLTVIPVLVGGARMPAAAELPSELAAFARCQAVEVRDTHFDEDAAGLVKFLAAGADERPLTLLGVRVDRRVLAGAIVVLFAALVATWAVRGRNESSTGTVIRQDAADISGEWLAAMLTARQEPYRIGLTLARSGGALTGSVRYPTGEAVILDGRVDGARFAFHTRHVPQFESEPATIQVAGTLDDGVIKLTVTTESGVMTGVATPVSEAVGRDPSAAAIALPSLAYGTWTLRRARDERGRIWDNSVLQFTSQTATDDGLALRGRFTWRAADELQGTEDVSGLYVQRTRQVILEGVAVANAAGVTGPERLAVGSYSAVLSQDERSLVDGRWGSTATNEPGVAGTWEAVR